MNQNDIKALNELKILSIDMINRAGGGSPGICLSMAPVMYSLFTRILNVFPKNETFINRDRVILSSSHITPLYYAMLYMAGFSVNKEDIMNYRKIKSKTPALPELRNPMTSEATTGICGDGVGMAVGFSLSRRYIEALIKEEDNKVNLLNYTTYCFISDADMMSGASEEAFAFAGAQHLENLVFLYDANGMGADGDTSTILEIDLEKSFAAKGFYVDTLKDSTNIKEITRAIEAAKNSKKPSLLIFKTKIGKDSFNEGKNIVHSGVLSLDDTNTLRRKYNLFLPPFEISKDSILHIKNQMTNRTTKFFNKWNEHYARLKNINNQNINNILNLLESGKTNIEFSAENYKINDGYRESLIESNYKIMNLIAPKSNLFLGGSAGLHLLTQTLIGGSDYLNATTKKGRNIRFGTRERAMSYILNGMSILGLRTFGSTELCFADEMKSGIRESAIMNLPVTYIFTHDSLYNQESSTIRVPIEQLTMLRSIPNFTVYRPADILELMGCWETILKSGKPSAIVLSKNSIPKLPGSTTVINKGAYIIKKETSKLDGIIIATGSEVVSSMQIAYDLARKGLDIRVVSMVSMELFLVAGKEYEEEILPKNIKTIVIESGSSIMWNRFATDENYIIGLNDFVPNGLPMEVLQNMNYDYDSLKLKVESLLLH